MIETADGSDGNVAVAKTASARSSSSRPAPRRRSTSLTGTSPGHSWSTKRSLAAAAGSQGEVRIAVSCDEAGVETPQPDFVIPAGTPSGTVSMSYPQHPGWLDLCVDRDGQRSLRDGHGGDRRRPTRSNHLRARTATANVVNTYEYVPGALVVAKDIAGPAAGQQGEVSIGVSCVLNRGAATLDPFVISAGQSAGIVSHTYEAIPAGSTCTVSETEDGSTSTVSVTTVGGNQTVSVPRRATRS